MGVDLYWRDERGKDLERLLDPHMLFSSHVLSDPWKGTSCLRFIDPYGNTIFNSLQIPTLIGELRASLDRHPDHEVRDHAAAVLKMLEGREDLIHFYAWFLGD